MEKSLEEKFWDRVNIKSEDECWEWKGAKSHNGYGLFSIRHATVIRANRMSWIIKNGFIPNGMFVCHKCDNPPCVNPSHLFLGTHSDNMQDMISKGRRGDLTGENHGRHKLTRNQVEEIRNLYSTGKYSQEKIASMYGVTQGCISAAVRRYRWK